MGVCATALVVAASVGLWSVKVLVLGIGSRQSSSSVQFTTMIDQK